MASNTHIHQHEASDNYYGGQTPDNYYEGRDYSDVNSEDQKVDEVC